MSWSPVWATGGGWLWEDGRRVSSVGGCGEEEKIWDHALTAAAGESPSMQSWGPPHCPAICVTYLEAPWSSCPFSLFLNKKLPVLVTAGFG